MALVIAACDVAGLVPNEPTLTLPAAGQVSAQWLDGDPVFVVVDADGTVRVLDGVSPHSTDDFTKVLAWCASSQRFEDLWHGSMFDRTGAYRAGPSPTGMAAYEITSVASGHVRVGRMRRAPGRPAPAREPTVLAGDRCDDRTAMYALGNRADKTVLDDLTVHEPGGEGRDLWLPTPERILGTAPTHPCSQVPPDAPAGSCSDSP